MKRQVLIGAVLGIALAVGLAWLLSAGGARERPELTVSGAPGTPALAPPDPVPSAPTHTLRAGPAVRIAPPRVPEGLQPAVPPPAAMNP